MDNRRDFIKKTTLASTGVVVGASAFSAKSYGNIMGANDRVVLGSIGVRGRGSNLLENFSEMYNDGVHIKTVCDVDSAVLGDNVKMAAKNQKGNKPGTEEDMRRVFEDKEIDAVVVAVPNHWHALATIWACQAGKHVYVEKPSSHNVWEGRKMVEAARKYNRVVQVGFQNRSISNVMQAMDFLHRGGIGEVFLSEAHVLNPGILLELPQIAYHHQP